MFCGRSSLPTRRFEKTRYRQLVVERLEERLTPAVSVVTYHNDLASTGQNLNETSLTYDSVNSAYFGKLYSTPLDGQAYAQPLNVSNVVIATGPNAGAHEVVYVATENNSVYAIDAVQGNVLWSRNFNDAAAGVTPIPYRDVNTEDLSPVIGITGTPAIDPLTGTMYLVVRTKEVGSGMTHYVQRLYALDLATGVTKLGGPKVIADTIYQGGVYTYVSGPSVNGTGDGSINGKITFNALREHQRPALLLYNNTVYIAFASHGDNGPYHGWILGYDATNLQLKAAFNATPNGGLGGIWMAGGGISVDSQGFLYASTGNGTFDTQLDSNGFPIHGNYGNSILKLAIDTTSTSSNQNINGWGLKVVDYFTPNNEAQLSLSDLDLGSAGVLILPDSVGSAAHPHLLVTSGKEGKIYLLDRDNLGKFNASADQALQIIPNGVNGLLGTPAFFNGSVYFVGSYGDHGKQFTVSNGVMSATPVALTSDVFLFPGSTPSVSANGTSNAIVWNLDRGTRELRAYKAGNYAQQLWTSNLAGSRDQIGSAIVKFSVPTVANGRVFVATTDAFYGFGLFREVTTPPAAPTNLVARAVSGTQVRLNWIDNSNNEAAFDIEASTDGVNFSRVATAPLNATEFVVGSLAPLNRYYFRVSATNVAGSSSPTNISDATTSSGGNPGGIDFSLGFAAAGDLVRYNGSATLSGDYLRLTSGINQQAGSLFVLDRRDVRQFTSQFAFQIVNGTNPPGDGITFTIQGSSPAALGAAGGGLGYGAGLLNGTPGILNSLAIKFDLASNYGEGNNSTGLYLNGVSPTIPGFINLDSSGIDLNSQHVFVVTITYDGSTLSVEITDTETNASVGQSYQDIDIPSIVGANDAFFGFTGATGASTSSQYIRAFTYAPLTQPPPPASLSATPTVGGVQLNWAAVDSAAFYNVYRSLTTNTQDVVPYATGVTGTTFLDSGIQNGVSYFYKVAAVNSLGESARSNEAKATTPTFPARPSDATASSVQTTRLQLRWKLNSTNETGIRILRKAGSDGIYDQIVSLPPGSTFYPDSGLTPGVVYSYHIIAFNDLGYSDFTGVLVQTLSAGPQNLTADASGGNVVLNWSPSLGATSYNVFRSELSYGIDESQEPMFVGVTSTTFTDPSALNGHQYYYAVQAVNDSGEGPLSSQTQVQVLRLPFTVGSFQNGVWTVDSNNNGVLDANDQKYTFGLPGDTPVWGDWNGDGTKDFGVYRQGVWYLDSNGIQGWQSNDTTVRFGIAGDIPVAGDWIGDRRDHLGVYRQGTWYIDNNGIFGWQPTDSIVRYGLPGDKPTAGDWRGDGRDRFAVYRDGVWYIDNNGIFGWQPTDTIVRYGVPGDTPVVGDWNGDGRDDMSVYRSDGHWYFDANGQFGWQTTDTVLTLDLGIANPIARTGRGGFSLDATAAWVMVNAPILTTSQLNPIVEAAITIWKNAGASEEQIAKLRRLNVRITDLPNDRLGMAWDAALAIDVNGAGRGWFIDASPSDHSEYQWRGDGGFAKSGAASKGIDLLTVVLHEMGHALGLDDGEDDLMMGQLGRGERRLPTASLVDAALSD